MWLRSVCFMFVATLLTGCVSAGEQRARDEEKCRSYGFIKRNDAFAECLQRIELNRHAEFRDRQWTFDDWHWPVVICRPIGSLPKTSPLVLRRKMHGSALLSLALAGFHA